MRQTRERQVMRRGETAPAPLALTLDEARALALAAQSLDAPGLHTPPGPAATAEDVAALIERLGVVQIDTISVVARSQYLVLWSRLGAYDARLLDDLLYPRREIFEYWSHAASILPMSDYPYYRLDMLRARVPYAWGSSRAWIAANPEITQKTLEAIRDRGPMASADFERPDDGRRAEAWDWYGLKDSRRALDALWTIGDLMVHSRRGGQKVYDLRERVLAEAFGEEAPSDDDLPSPHERLRYLTLRTTRALGIVTPSWLWDYFRLRDPLLPTDPAGRRTTGKARAQAHLEALSAEGAALPVVVEGLGEPAWIAAECLPALERLRAGAVPARTTLLSPFDSLIWSRARARALFGYEVCFEAYVVPEKRRYGYYSLAILRRGRLVGRLDPKMERKERRLTVRALYLEPGVSPDPDLLDDIASTLRDLAAFLGAQTIAVERADPPAALKPLRERVKRTTRAPRRTSKKNS